MTSGNTDSGHAMSTTVGKQSTWEAIHNSVTSVESADIDPESADTDRASADTDRESVYTDPDQNQPRTESSRAGKCSRDITSLMVASSLLLLSKMV